MIFSDSDSVRCLFFYPTGDYIVAGTDKKDIIIYN